MEFYVGTSGWMYGWNEAGSLEWYLENTPFNAVELNASFYRFPFKNQVKGWVRRGAGLRWSIKVHRSVTHVHRLNEKAIERFRKFRGLFAPMEDAGLIDFYLIQLPPNFKPTQENVRRLERFLESAGLGEMIAVEFRRPEWYSEELLDVLSAHSATAVSVDAPGLGTIIVRTSSRIYVRLHGRTAWYSHVYSTGEIREILERVIRVGGESAYIFLNNDHGMLPTGTAIVEELKRRGLWRGDSHF